jgi:hypothetical protein
MMMISFVEEYCGQQEFIGGECVVFEIPQILLKLPQLFTFPTFCLEQKVRDEEARRWDEKGWRVCD